MMNPSKLWPLSPQATGQEKKVGTKAKHQARYVGSVGGIYCMDGNEGKQFIVWD